MEVIGSINRVVVGAQRKNRVGRVIYTLRKREAWGIEVMAKEEQDGTNHAGQIL